jgi:hypothetical protein
MFTHPTKNHLWASITSSNRVRVMCDDGCENILSYHKDFNTLAEAEAHLAAEGFAKEAGH